MSIALPAPPGGRSPLSRALSLVGVAAVAVVLVARAQATPVWALLAAITGLAGWALLAFLPARSPRVVRRAALAVMILSGALAAVPTQVVGAVPLVVGLVGIVADVALAWWAGLVAALVAATLLAGVTLAAPPPPGVIVGAVACIALGSLIGVTRRQQVTARIAESTLAAERLATQTERARSAALDERARIARDLHDTLAHSLGALVVQLDAVEALAEAGRTEEVLARARSARSLAAEGLVEARRAVQTLREEPAGPVDGPSVEQAIADLVDRERGLGAAVTATLDGGGLRLEPAAAEALRRAAQEALTNARKHAPGRPVEVSLSGTATTLVLEVSNTLTGLRDPAHPLASSGSQRGISGMRERIASVPGATLRVGELDGRFIVRMEVPVS
ncbi:hypothetical protein GCM10010988_00750 [Cnuibacter physcomitrellae]|uniref:histidine kinase n=1 Tax=Cnuibacter physcomitrellae TaxID=1619308 RepID=A0A1X9LIN5_9MICO|nr:histidine kinase [Cnuibacter physcomitrellae]ARJ05034.1 hypothetical protein B5808_07330 [Cnuibacter physcomitrellae]GGI34803.1 hypothetical protein GCM10010988_00750 [Cnuibacter physcomitrellae]